MVETIDVFNTFKSKLADLPLLSHLQSHTPHMIDFDASAYELGAVPHTQQNNNNLKKCATNDYCSLILN